MKIILAAVNAKYIHSNPAVYSLAGYAKSYLTAEEKMRLQVVVREYTINQTAEQIIAGLYKEKPDILAFSCYIWNWNMIREVMTEMHQLLPGVPIFLGGPEVSYTPEQILREFPFLAGIMIGEGEETFLELCRFYLKGQEEGELPVMPGLVTGEANGGCRMLTRLEDIPFFYDDMEAFANRIVYYESSRGCPYRCSYCLSSIDKRVRLKNLELVKKELQFFLDRKVPQVKFIDRTFNCSHDHAMTIWRYIREHDNGITNFHFEIAADILNNEELELLGSLRPGQVQLEIGVQSTNPATIRAINRVMNLDNLKKAVAVIHQGQNIHQHLDLIAGLPEEGLESFKQSFNEVYRMEPDQLQLGFLKVLKGSLMWEKAGEYGIVYRKNPPYEVLYTKWLSYDEVLLLKAVEEMVELYYNSGQFAYTLAMLVKEFTSPFALMQSLAEFYEKNGYHLQSPARSYRYQILLEFAAGKAPEREEMYRQLLTFDLYLRENAKTRPGFAPDQEGLKEAARAIYKREEEERRLLPSYSQYDSRQMQKMTHLEQFTFRVWEKGRADRLSAPRLVIFDYQSRNPLTRDAGLCFPEQGEKGRMMG